MSKPKVCLGCFCEWEEETSVCSHCGWDYEKKLSPYPKWNVGDVLDQRYLTGQTYYEAKDITVWRMYDNILGCPVWVLYGEKKTKDDLRDIAWQLQKAQEKDSNTLKILTVRQIDKRDVLVFSIKDRYMAVENFEKWLSAVEKSSKKLSMEKAQSEESTFAEQKPPLPEKVLPEGTCLDNRYKIIKCLGIGGFGITYLCEDMFLHRNVAVKEYYPEQWAERDDTYVAVIKSSVLSAFQYGMKSFGKEIQITAKFIHTPHIVTVYDAFEDNDTLYMVMEYIEGLSIGKEFRHREYKPYTITEMAEIILPLLDALEAIHEKNLVHSDISPGNIIRAEKGEIVLIDMGAAKYVLDSQPTLNAAFLKIDYAAPEQYRTAKEGVPRGEGPWTDMYAVGATMYYLLTGHKPTDVITRLSSKKTDFVPPKKYKVKLSKHWMKLIHYAAAVDRNKRISSAAELREEMGKLLE